MKNASRLFKSIVVLIILVVMLSTQTASAYTSSNGVTAPEKLQVYVGYWGGPYTLKVEFNRSELESMVDYQGYYSYVTRVGTVMMQYARGVTIEKILNYAQIDKNSVRQFDFYTVDVKDTYFTSKGRTELLDTTRYYFPNIRANGYTDWETGKWIVTDEEAARAGAIAVPTILATQQFATKDPNVMPQPSQITPEDSFRLCSGQVDTSSPTSFESAKWVHSVYVVLSGSPPQGVTINQGDSLNMKVGSMQQLNCTLIGDSILESEMKNIKWSSSDPSIVKVDPNGRITVKKEGTAIITATTSNGKVATIVINPKKEDKTTTDKNQNPPTSKKEETTKDDKKAEIGGGYGKGSKGYSKNKFVAVPDISHSVPLGNSKNNQQLKSISLAGYQQIVISGMPVQEEDGGGSVLWRTKGMAKDATALGKIKQNTKGNVYAGVSAVTCLTIGLAFRIKKYFGDI